MDFSTVAVEADGAVGRLVLRRPERLNALSGQLMEELIAAAAWFDARREVKVVVIRGEGRAFCAGVDLADFQRLLAGGPTGTRPRDAAQLGRRMADAIEHMGAVTIAAVHGVAVGGGVVLMAACDLRVVAEDTYLAIPEVDLGIPLAWGGVPRLLRELGPALTKELVMTCRPFSPAEALARGFVNRVAPADQLDGEVAALVATLADKAPIPLQVTKTHVNALSRHASLADMSLFEGDSLLAALSDPDSAEAALRYLDRLGEQSDREV